MGAGTGGAGSFDSAIRAWPWLVSYNCRACERAPTGASKTSVPRTTSPMFGMPKPSFDR